MNLPQPPIFVNWTEWANALVAKLGPIVSRLSGEEPTVLLAFSKTKLPSPARYKQTIIYVTDEAGGPVPAFSDGVAWRRVTDRAVVS